MEASGDGLETIEGDRVTAPAVSRTRDGLRRGETVDRYVVLDRIGSGGMGAVYAAFDPQLDRKIALKLLHSERDTGEHLLVEARAMAQLDHPNTVTVHDVGEHDGRIFLAMEYIDGTTLREFTIAKPRPWSVVLAAFMQAGRGLAAAHSRGLLHRDFKPDNVMVDRAGADDPDGPARVRVLDFGLARVDSANLTLSGRVPVVSSADASSGTPAYMSPEQFLGAAITAASDQFAFCVALYEALCGTRPFAGSSAHELAMNVVAGDLRPASGTAPPWLRRVVERGLAVDPTQRWPSMDALLEALSRDPTRRRRLVTGAVIGVTLVGVAIGAVQIDRSRRLAGCDAGNHLVAETWSPEIADEIAAAFAASPLGYATDAWTRARARLDRLAERWHDTAANNCRATIQSERSSTMADATRHCLADVQDRMSVVLERLRLASPTAIEEAITWTADLPDPASCEDSEVAARWIARPGEADTAEVANIRRGLFEIKALQLDNQADEAMALAESLIMRATALGHTSLMARARISWSGAANAAEREQARVHGELLQAFHSSVTAMDDEVALDAAIALAYHISRVVDQPEEAVVWARVAESFRERLALPEDSPQALEVITARASAERGAGHHEEAYTRMRRVAELKRQALSSDHPDLAESIGNLAIVDIDRGHFEESVALLDEALAIGERAFGPHHPRMARWYAALAITYARWDRAAIGEPHLRRAVEIETIAFGEDHPSTARSKINHGAILNQLDRHAEAAVALESAIATLRRGEIVAPHSLAGALQNLGNARGALGDPTGAVAAYTEAIDLFRDSLGPGHGDVARARVALATFYEDRGELDEARRRYSEAIEMLTDTGGSLRAEAYVALGRASILAGDYVAAELACHHAVDVLRLLPESSRGGAGAFCLATARWHRKAPSAEVVALAREARAGYRQTDGKDRIAALDAWIASDATTAPPPFRRE